LKNTLRGFVDFTLLDAGLAIHGAAIHEKENRRWLSLPSREYIKNGERTWIPVVEFASRESRDRISNAVLSAFDEFSAAGAR
jgi:DNA-binding cell septation regulator SpoVG